jgi:hypothetical protein
MSEDSRRVMDDVARQWLKSREIIKSMLKELRPDMTEAQHDHNAAAIIARLAHAEPPLLICEPHEMKE